MKKIFFMALAIFFISMTSSAYADVYSNLQKLDGAAYAAGQSIYKKKSNLTTTQSYQVCKIFMLKYNKKLAEGNRNPNYKQFLHYMSPAEVTYCWAGYIKTKSLFKIDEIAYLIGKRLYNQNPDLSTRQSYMGCENDSAAYNKSLEAKVGNPNYKVFLDFITPAEYTYCWVGYLDAAGANK